MNIKMFNTIINILMRCLFLEVNLFYFYKFLIKSRIQNFQINKNIIQFQDHLCKFLDTPNYIFRDGFSTA